jgi:hypothetical protein
MNRPIPTWLYRLTHLQNLSHILRYGLVTAQHPDANPDFIRIGDSSLIEYRTELPAPDPPGGVLADYIPFYLGPRQPMLYQIASGWEDIRQFDQEDIIYVISSVESIENQNLSYFFTDAHARSETSNKFTDSAQLDHFDWSSIYAKHWRNDVDDLRRKEKKQAEFLVKWYVPVSCIHFIGVYNKLAETRVSSILAAANISIAIRISPEKLYYDHL